MSTDQAAALADALTHLGPAQLDIVPHDAAVEVTGDPTVLREATRVAIEDAGERLSALCTALLRGEASAVDVRAQLESLRGLLDLL